MIFTVTFNPSLDYVVELPALSPGCVNRTDTERLYPGGKGINVSIMLSNLGHKSRALGFCAGFTGCELKRLLQSCGCDAGLIPLKDGFTRINVKIRAQDESEINGQGPRIPQDALNALFDKLDDLQKDDILVLAGSVPNTLPGDVYERIWARLEGRGIRFVVDATGDLLLNVLKYRPFLIKPNDHELGGLFGVTLRTREEIVYHAKKLRQMGAQNVLVSMAGDGAILLTEQGDILESPPPKGQVVNSVGAGDSMVAGFLAGWLSTGDYQKAFSLSLAAGSATAFSEWLASKEDVARLLDHPEDYGLS